MRSSNEYPPPPPPLPPPPITVLIHIQSATPIEKHNGRGGIHEVVFSGGPRLKSKSIGSTSGASQRQRNKVEEGYIYIICIDLGFI